MFRAITPWKGYSIAHFSPPSQSDTCNLPPCDRGSDVQLGREERVDTVIVLLRRTSV